MADSICYQVRLLRPQQLTTADWQRWDALQTADATLASPYFRPEFTKAVARVRRDVEVAVIENGGEVAGFFPFQRDRLNLGRPVGGKLSDYHGLIADRETSASIDAAWLMRQCQLSGWDFDHLPATQSCFVPFARSEGYSRQMDLSAGFDAYVNERRAAGTDAVKRAFQQERRFSRDFGPLRFEAHTTDHRVFQQLVEWKSAQYLRTGLADVFAFPWVLDLLRELQLHSSPELSLELSALWCNDELAAAMLSLRSRNVIHSWFPAYNLKFQDFAPGIQLYLQLARQCSERGFTSIDFGTGDERYKRSLGNVMTRTLVGSIEQPSLGIWLRRGWRSTRDLLQGSGLKNVATVPMKLLQPVREWLAYR